MDEKIKFLRQYHDLLMKIDECNKKIDLYHHYADEASSPMFGPHVPSSNINTKAPFMKWLYKVEEWEKEADKYKEQLPEIKNKVLSAIQLLSNVDYQRVLILRYIEWKTWTEIMEEIYVSRQTLYRWHINALTLLTIPPNEIGTS